MEMKVQRTLMTPEEEDLLAAIRAMRDRSDPHISRLLAADCAERVLLTHEQAHQGIGRTLHRLRCPLWRAIKTTRRRRATGAERAAAWTAARRAEREAMNSASALRREAEQTANWDQARAKRIARAAERQAARAVMAGYVKIATAGGVEEFMECIPQAALRARFMQYRQHGEAAAQMPWPEAQPND